MKQEKVILWNIGYFFTEDFLESFDLALAISSSSEYKKSLLDEKSTHQYHITDSSHTLLIAQIIPVDIDITEFALKMSEPSRDLKLDAIAIVPSDVDDILHWHHCSDFVGFSTLLSGFFSTMDL
jgi:hypothetical protein